MLQLQDMINEYEIIPNKANCKRYILSRHIYSLDTIM